MRLRISKSAAAEPTTVVHRLAAAGDVITLDASASSDPDEDKLRFQWQIYPEPAGYHGPHIDISDAASPRAAVTLPQTDSPATIHIILMATDEGQPPLTRYGRVVIQW